MNNVDMIEGLDISKIRQMLNYYDCGDVENASLVANEIIYKSQSDLFQEVGRLTRDLHDALQAFRLDDRVTVLAQEEIPDAKERLNYVIAMTEQSANRVLNAVEESLPITEAFNKYSNEYRELWANFINRKMQLSEFKELCARLSEYFEWSSSQSENLKNNLSNVLMAQDFQDLTGQIIKKVINLVNDVEESLVNLIKITSEKIQTTSVKAKTSDEDREEQALTGPRVPGINDDGMVSGQDDVDALLSSLGF